MSQLYRLNTNQVRGRVRTIRPLLEDADAISVRSVLVECGVWARLQDVFGLGQAEASAAEADDMELDLLADDALRAAVQRGDMAAVRILEARREKAERLNEWNVQINIVPYRIADPTLPRIARESDESVIRDVMIGIMERAADERCPEAVLSALRAGVGGFLEWAEEAWAGAMDGPGSHQTDATGDVVQIAGDDEVDV